LFGLTDEKRSTPPGVKQSGWSSHAATTSPSANGALRCLEVEVRSHAVKDILSLARAGFDVTPGRIEHTGQVKRSIEATRMSEFAGGAVRIRWRTYPSTSSARCLTRMQAQIVDAWNGCALVRYGTMYGRV